MSTLYDENAGNFLHVVAGRTAARDWRVSGGRRSVSEVLIRLWPVNLDHCHLAGGLRCPNSSPSRRQTPCREDSAKTAPPRTRAGSSRALSNRSDDIRSFTYSVNNVSHLQPPRGTAHHRDSRSISAEPLRAWQFRVDLRPLSSGRGGGGA